jgi:fumarate hydratase class II
MNMATAIEVHRTLIPTLKTLCRSIDAKAKQWKNIVKLGRTHLQDATPITLGQEFSGYASLLQDNIKHIQDSLRGVYHLALGGTAVGTGINTIRGFDREVAAQIAQLTALPFVTAENKFAVQGSHNALAQLSGSLRNLAASLYKIGNDIRLLSCGPRAGFYELLIPANEPGSSIMPGKVNPTQCEALCMVAVQVMSNDLAVAFGDAGGYLEMNVYKPLIIYNIMHSLNLLSDSCRNFEKFLIRGTKPNLKRIKNDLENSLMLVTALSPVIGYDKASQIAHHAMDHDLKLKDAALQLGFVTAEQFDRLVNPLAMCHPSKL